MSAHSAGVGQVGSAAAAGPGNVSLLTLSALGVTRPDIDADVHAIWGLSSGNPTR